MGVMPEPPRITRIEEIEPIPAGGVGYRLVRRTLGIEAFGINGFTADEGVHLIEEHDEMGVNGGRHEELYVVMTGSARFTIDGAEHDASAGTLVFIPDPESRRSAVALEDGTSALAIGGRAGEPYEVSPWEPSVAAQALAAAGDADGAADLMAREAAARPDKAGILYNAACFEALAGRREDALAHLREALALEPETVRGWAEGDRDLDSLRDDPAFPA
jgi:tetratricopeptide (TPR) repeat protein